MSKSFPKSSSSSSSSTDKSKNIFNPITTEIEFNSQEVSPILSENASPSPAPQELTATIPKDMANSKLSRAYFKEMNSSSYKSLTTLTDNPFSKKAPSKTIVCFENPKDDIEMQDYDARNNNLDIDDLVPVVYGYQSPPVDPQSPDIGNLDKIRRSYWYNVKWGRLLGILAIFIGILLAVVYATVKKVLDISNEKAKPGLAHLHEYGRLAGAKPLIDPDTPQQFYHKEASDGNIWDLVFSDEFNQEGRSFYPGDDAFWEAVDIHYAATNNKEWYDPDMVTTKKGCLSIKLDSRKQHNLNYTSAMLQGWNKMCFTQGILEASIKMPGSYDAKGLWPAFWALGNLGRAGYMSTTDGIWPYSYDSCDAGSTANQSSPDGISHLPGQRLSSCVCSAEDHPTPGKGRGAPEIDILEGYHNLLSQSFNVGPFDIWKLPDYDFLEIHNKSKTVMNDVYGNEFQEIVSTFTTSNLTWFDKAPRNMNSGLFDSNYKRFQRFAMEYRSDHDDNSKNYIKFYIGEEETFSIYGNAFHPDGNINWRLIPKEPLYIILNLGLSEQWSPIKLNSFDLPATMDVDYVRLYQPKDAKSLSCDPPNYETTEYIAKHPIAYMNPNMTTWNMAGYKVPKSSLTGRCHN